MITAIPIADGYGGGGGGGGGGAGAKVLSPYGIAISDDRIYVAHFLNNDVQIFDLEGNQISKFGSYGTQVGQLSEPHGIA